MTWNYKHTRIVVLILCMTRAANAYVNNGGFNISLSGDGDSVFHNNQTFKVVPITTDGFSLIMEEHKSIVVDFYVVCQDGDDHFYLDIKSTDSGIFSIQNYKAIHISCKNTSVQDDQGTDQGYETLTNNDGTKYIKNGTIKLDLYGVIIGGASIQFVLQHSNSSLNSTSKRTGFIIEEHKMTVFRRIRPVDTIFRVIIYFFLIFATLAFGCKLDLEVVKESLKKPIAPGIGLACQYVVMPLIGYGVAKVVTAQAPSVSLGIFVCGCCPGGGASNIYAHLLNGDLSLSITMTAISTVAALGMLPFWLYTLGQEFIDETANVSIPFVNIITTLIILIVPLFVGLLIKYKLPKVRKIFLKVVTPVTVVAIIILLTVGIYSNLYIFKLFKPRIVLAGCLLPYIGYVLGGIISLIFRQPWERVKTISIETGMQNTGIAIILMIVAFPPPYGEIAAVAPIASGVMTPLPIFVITIAYLIYKRCNKDKYDKVPVKNGTKEKGTKEKGTKTEKGECELDLVGEKLSAV